MDRSTVKRFLIGPPFPTSHELHERLDKVRGLAVFASDPISSNAYATEAIMGVLVVLGSAGLQLTMPVAVAVAALVLTVVFTYIQTILHYPQGGGAYMVAKDNLGRLPSLIAGGALLPAYILTVSVSASAGVRAVTSAIPEVQPYRVWLALLAILLITWMNLRGAKESGTVFAVPTYAFVAFVWVVIAIGLVRYFGLFGLTPLEPLPASLPAQETLTGVALIWLILRAFASGTTALTGIEAISDGVQAFKPPESKNAAETMVVMGFMASSLFVGISFLATRLNLVPAEAGETILSQMTRQITSGVPLGNFLYVAVQAFTALILFLAANTAYQDFPRLSSFLARDGFMPRWMQNRGDRLVFSSGIIVLTIISAVLVVIFQADEIRMLPLYAVGVMVSFTLSQAGMFVLMGKIGRLQPGESVNTTVTQIHYEPNWRWKQALNALGAFVTGVVFIILLATRFLEGAWIIAVLIPLLVMFFYAIHRHYESVAAALSTRGLDESDFVPVAPVAIVPIADVHRGTIRALKYARRIADDVRAVSIATSPEVRERLERRWARFPNLTAGIRYEIIDYDFRDILDPLIDYIEHVNNVEFPGQLVTVVVPEFIAESFWAGYLHNQTANFLRRRLRNQENLIIIDVPFHVEPIEHADDETPGVWRALR